MGTICIVCQKEKAGSLVYDDIVIRSIRRVKQALGMAQNNKLVVCKNCIDEHKKRRSDFEKKLVRYGAAGGIIAVLIVLLSRNLLSILFGLFIIALMLAFTLPFYHPSLLNYPKAAVSQSKAKQKPKK